MFTKDTLKNFFSLFFHDSIAAYHKAKQEQFVVKKNAKIISRLLRSSSPIKLELGAGNRKLDGWTAIDIGEHSHLNLDLTKPMPFPDNSVTMIYSSHVLEHFRIEDLLNLLYECRRILVPSGKFSACVPNAKIFIDAYHRPESFNPDIFCRFKPAYQYYSKIDFLNYIAYMGGHHRYMFDEENLCAILRKTGFRFVKPRDFDPILDLEVRAHESIYVEAEK